MQGVQHASAYVFAITCAFARGSQEHFTSTLYMHLPKYQSLLRSPLMYPHAYYRPELQQLYLRNFTPFFGTTDLLVSFLCPVSCFDRTFPIFLSLSQSLFPLFNLVVNFYGVSSFHRFRLSHHASLKPNPCCIRERLHSLIRSTRTIGKKTFKLSTAYFLFLIFMFIFHISSCVANYKK